VIAEAWPLAFAATSSSAHVDGVAAGCGDAGACTHWWTSHGDCVGGYKPPSLRLGHCGDSSFVFAHQIRRNFTWRQTVEMVLPLQY